MDDSVDVRYIRSVRRAYKSMAAAASREDPTHAAQVPVPPPRLRGPPLWLALGPPAARLMLRPLLPPPRLASATSTRLATQRSTTTSAHSGRTLLPIFFWSPG
jgi:hypothetical protein|uniref:Uncharacterized protein n=1 Tax=Zea mays TaxID=4577 RepID=A0A804NC81_MAIZE